MNAIRFLRAVVEQLHKDAVQLFPDWCLEHRPWWVREFNPRLLSVERPVWFAKHDPEGMFHMEPNWMATMWAEWTFNHHTLWMMHNYPTWCADHHENTMTMHRPDWMLKNRPALMFIHFPEWMMEANPKWVMENVPSYLTREEYEGREGGTMVLFGQLFVSQPPTTNIWDEIVKAANKHFLIEAEKSGGTKL